MIINRGTQLPAVSRIEKKLISFQLCLLALKRELHISFIVSDVCLSPKCMAPRGEEIT